MMVLSEQQIDEAVKVLQDGGVLLYPTETSYGLGCDATNEEAVQKIYTMKRRPANKAMTVLIPDVASAGTYVDLSEQERELAQKYWPGALNIAGRIAQESPVSPSCASNGRQSVRVSSHAIAGDIAKRFGKPIVSTSANPSGQAAAYTWEEAQAVAHALAITPDAIVNGGDLPSNAASTVVLVKDGDVQVLRQGEIVID